MYKGDSVDTINKIYPLTIIKSRYGYYGNWYAFNLEAEEIDSDVYGGDGDSLFAIKNNQEYIGIGQTPQLAIEDLFIKLNKEVSEDV